MKRLAAGGVLLVLLGLASGCANVKPYQRGTLADYTMRADRDPLADSLHEHIYFTPKLPPADAAWAAAAAAATRLRPAGAQIGFPECPGVR